MHTPNWTTNPIDLQLVRDSKNALGLSIVGGIDHCSHPFGTDNLGVFISKIANKSPASASRQLRVGDIILRLNGKDVEKAKHSKAVELSNLVLGQPKLLEAWPPSSCTGLNQSLKMPICRRKCQTG
uniref:PDZ domain-containing protein n=1 Tax=Ditylenchus dipsaci TaxID=166011 RepID=A0A915DZ44_9BILA